MCEEFGKVLFTAQDHAGHDVWLVRLIDGRWAILQDGECFAVGWPDGMLTQATRAYRELIVGNSTSKS